MQSEHKNNVLLTELIIVILFFALIAVIVVQMFVAAHKRSSLSVRTQEALIIAENWVERLSGRADPAGFLLGEGFVQTDPDTYALTTREGELLVEARLEGEIVSEAGRLIAAEVRVFDNEHAPEDARGEPLIALSAASYLPAVSTEEAAL